MTEENAVPAAPSPAQADTQGINPAPEATPQENAETPKPDNDPEKLAKALARKDRRIQRKDAQIHELRRQLDQYQQTPTPRPGASQQPAKPERLKPENFSSVEDYVEQVAEQKARALYEQNRETGTRQAPTREQMDQIAHVARQQAVFQTKAEKLAEAIPDFNQVMHDNVDAPCAPHVMEALHEAENGPLVAYYALKEDLLDDLNAMSPAKAAIEISRLEEKAKSLLNAKPVSKAPTPMKTTSGTSGGSRALHNKTAKELVAWVRS